jgi:hypothetical protein
MEWWAVDARKSLGSPAWRTFVLAPSNIAAMHLVFRHARALGVPFEPFIVEDAGKPSAWSLERVA